MTIERLDVPWAGAPAIPARSPAISGVDVLPGYASTRTASTPSTLSQPWSGQTLSVPQLPEVTSLIGMALSQ